MGKGTKSDEGNDDEGADEDYWLGLDWCEHCSLNSQDCNGMWKDWLPPRGKWSAFQRRELALMERPLATECCESTWALATWTTVHCSGALRGELWSLATGVSPSWGLLHGGATCIRSVWCDSRYVIVHAVLIVKSFYLKTEILIYVLLTIFTYSMIWFTINLWISSQSCAKNASDFEYKHVSCIWFIIYVNMQALIKSKPF